MSVWLLEGGGEFKYKKHKKDPDPESDSGESDLYGWFLLWRFCQRSFYWLLNMIDRRLCVGCTGPVQAGEGPLSARSLDAAASLFKNIH